MLHYHHYADTTALDTALAYFIANTLNQAIEERGEAYVALSGGKTPVSLFIQLRKMPIAWQKVRILLVDERWVDPTHSDSNTHLIATHLLQDAAAEATFISLQNNTATPHIGQSYTEIALADLPVQLDIIVLGMGEDGHTASLFPEAPELEAAFKTTARCAAITPITAPHLRMTLTAPYIAQARKILLHITGQSKKRLLNQWLADNASQPNAPIRRLFDLVQTEKYVFWAE